MDNKKQAPVFFDFKNKRWPRVKNGFFVFIILLFILISFFLASIFIAPALNELPISSVKHLTKITYPVVNKNKKQKDKFLFYPIKNKNSNHAIRQSSQPLIFGFLVNYDDASFQSLMRNRNNIDVVIGDFLHIDNANGDISEDNSEKQNLVNDYLDKHHSKIKLIPLVSNIKNESWQPQMIADLLASPEQQQKLIQNLLNYVGAKHYSGINIDFEEIPKKNKQNLTEFIKNLTTVFHQNGLTVSIDVIGDDPAYDMSMLSTYVDYVIIMDYDEHWENSLPGPIAGIDWFSKTLKKHIQEIPSAKLVIGLANYGYDWINNKKTAEEINFEDLMIQSDLSHSKIVFDPKSLNPSVNYLEDEQMKHTVWFLDAVTLFNQVSVSQLLRPYGYSVWRLGSEDPSIWNLLGHHVGHEDISTLGKIAPGYLINYQGKGEVINVAHKPQEGKRTLQYDLKLNLITNEIYDSFPTTYIINRFGGADPKKIALTFDDGPDPTYTEEILDILKANNAHATFFVIGANAMLYPKILKREFAEGHDIGNHTFTHPNIAEISLRQLIVEVTFTERLLESYLGRGSHLFRPPYAEDTEPETAGDVTIIDALTELGYLTVGMNIDPMDWVQPGVDEIVKNIVTGLEHKDGNIILLHDSGGDRKQTVEALPQIIAEIKARGYQLVTLSELINLPQAKVMPAANKKLWQYSIDYLTFKIMSSGSHTLKIVFFFCICLGLIRIFFLCILAVYQKYKDNKPNHQTSPNYSVAVIVPAYNEEKVIQKTIDSLLEADHPEKFQIIIVNDGSKDDTLRLVEESYGTHPLITIISQENMGKSAALNNAISYTDADIIITMDGDTLFSKTTINELLYCFSDEQVGAVAGNIKVGNKVNLLTRMQSVEYITSQNLERRAFKVLNAITVIPGCVGAWRRDLVIQAGGFSQDTLAEDADLTIKLQRLGSIIVYADKAIAYTEAPDKIKTFLQQRYRWMFGTFQVAWKHLDMLFRPSYNYMGMVALPSILIYQIIYPLIAPIMDLLLILLIGSSLINHFYHPAAANDDSLIFVLTFYVFFTLIDFFSAYLSFTLEKNESKKSLLLLIPQRFFYRQLIYYVALKTILTSIRGHNVSWNKVVRKANVKVKKDSFVA